MKAIRELFLVLLVMVVALMSDHANASAPLRRPVTPQQPMWLIHIDTWNYPDPQKIIDLVPADIRPYVVMNISLSISHNQTTSQFQVAEYGYETAKSWLRVCAENRMWVMIQPSSGGFSQFSDFDLSVYHEFFRDYPNFIGFNYAEQFWGYDQADDNPPDPLSANWVDRINHFADLLQVCNQYGGYLVVSWCGNEWSPNINPLAMLKRNAAFAAASRDYTENYILCEKYTQQGYQSDMESVCLGSWLSGYAGQYGMRYDDTGWTDSAGAHENFTMATQGAPFLEHVMLTGQTVFDGPELIWTQCFRELGTGATTDGYTMRRWDTYPQFNNVSIDLFRKVVDGTVRIPSRQEVIDRTKFVVINNVNSGTADTIYSSPDTLFEGLYRMDGDGNLRLNKTFFKKTGRYPTIPTVYQLDDSPANSFQVKVNRSAYATRWPAITTKVDEFNAAFPEQSTGDLYAGRHENGWVVYNPYKTAQTASGSIPFKYNTCDHMELAFSQYTAGVVKETAGQLKFYLSNYDNVVDTGLKTDTIAIYGATVMPTWSFADRGSHLASVITPGWSGGVFTLTVQHNGPLDLTVNCAGTATGRLTAYTPSGITAPSLPGLYAGPRQYEAECFDYKNITGITKGGQNGTIRNYRGQGYLQFGNTATAAVRDTVTVLGAGTYKLQTRYAVTTGSIGTIDLYVNGTKVADPVFNPTPTLSDWAILEQSIALNAGSNSIEFRATASGAGSLYLDGITVIPTTYQSGLVIQENEAGFGGVDGTIDNNNAGYTGSGFANTNDAAGSGIDWWLDFPATGTGAFTFRYASLEDRVADLYVNGAEVASGIRFPATGSLSAWELVAAHGAVPAGLTHVRLEAVSTTGLPDIDFLGVGGDTASGNTAPLADTYVRDGGNAAANFGTSEQLVTKTDGGTNSGFNRVAFLRFDVSGLANAQSVRLKLVPFQVDDGAAVLNYEGLADDSWAETAMTWNNRPTAAGTLVATAGGYVVGQPISIDVTGIAKSEAAGDGILSLRLTQPNSGNNFTGFHSRESATVAFRPVLEYTIAVPTVTAGAVKSAYLRFDDASGTTAADSTGHGWNGTLAGGPSWVSGNNARVNGALAFSGGSHLTLPAGIVAGIDDFTLSFWLKPGTITDGARAFDFSDGTAANRMSFIPRTAGGAMRFEIVAGGVAQALETPSSPHFQPGLWKHVTITQSGTSAKLYLDGIETAAGTMTHRPENLGITTANLIGAPDFNGTIDEFRIYKGTLSAADVARLSSPPAAPANLSATPANGMVTLGWTAVNGASSYSIRRSTISGGPYVELAMVTGTTFQDSTVTNGATYYYVVAAGNGISEGGNSTEASATPKAFGQSGGIVSMEAENGYLGSRWQTIASGSASSGAYLQVNPIYNNIGTAPEGTTPEYLASYQFNIATAGNHRFWFRVFAANADDDSFFWRIDGGNWTMENGRVGNGTWYSVDSAQLDALATGGHVLDVAYRENGAGLDKFVIQLDSVAAPTGNGPAETLPPASPGGLNITAVQPARVDLSWPATSGAASYTVKRSTTSGGPYTAIASGLATTAFNDATVASGTTYHYVVTASNGSGESGPSPQASATPAPAPVPITEEELRAPEIHLTGGNTNITIDLSVSGHLYQLQYSDNLAVETWQNHGPPQTGTGGPLEFIMPVEPDAGRRFYRLLILTP